MEEEFDENFTYVVRDLIIEKVPIHINHIVEVENNRLLSQAPFPFEGYTSEPGVVSFSQHTLSIVKVWESKLDNSDNRKNIRVSFAFCRKFERILGKPINTILTESERSRETIGHRDREIVKLNNRLVSARRKLGVVKSMSLFDRLMFVVEGYDWVKILINKR